VFVVLASTAGVVHPALHTERLRARCVQLCTLISEGKLKPTVSKAFPLAEAAAAHELGEAGHVRGKVAINVAAA
jgi:NADPH:quinone reductase-like Zn-dependent oxidoreductase